MASRSVLVVVGNFPEFSQTFVIDHIRGLAAHGWEVHVAARHVDAPALARADLDNVLADVYELAVPGRRQPLRRLRALATTGGAGALTRLGSVSLRAASYLAPSLRQVVAAVAPTVVHAHFAHNGMLAALAADMLPVIVTYHGYDVLQLPLREGWGAFEATLGSTYGVVHSTFLERHVAAHLDVALHRVTLGVDPALFAGVDRPEVWSRPVKLLTVGRLVPAKGHDVAIDALAHLDAGSGSGPFRLDVVGDGPHRQRLESQVRRAGLEDLIRFHGALPPGDVAARMAAADVLLVPSVPLDGWEESFCRVAVEGLASGLPVIGTQTGGLAETIGTGGEVVAPGDAGELAAAIRALVARETPGDVAVRARRQAARFSITQMWEDYDAVTRMVVAGR